MSCWHYIRLLDHIRMGFLNSTLHLQWRCRIRWWLHSPSGTFRSLQCSFHTIPLVLDIIIGSIGQHLCHGGPTSSKLGMQVTNSRCFVFRPVALAEARTQVVFPALAALFGCTIVVAMLLGRIEFIGNGSPRLVGKSVVAVGSREWMVLVDNALELLVVLSKGEKMLSFYKWIQRSSKSKSLHTSLLHLFHDRLLLFLLLPPFFCLLSIRGRMRACFDTIVWLFILNGGNLVASAGIPCLPLVVVT